MKPFMQKKSGLAQIKPVMKPSILAAVTKTPGLVDLGRSKKVLQTFKEM
jgi:hypothetical protein